MKQIVFATGNSHKLQELSRMLATEAPGLCLLGLREIGLEGAEIPEDAATFEGNALAKAQWIMAHADLADDALVIADDSGLEVDALGGAPGVLSARFAGKAHDDEANNRLLLSRLQGLSKPEERTARFRTAICLLEGRDATPRYFSGAVEGNITEAERGHGGFGYDPLFIPDGWTKTFAEGTPEEKDSVSHRGRAVRALVNYLKTANK